MNKVVIGARLLFGLIFLIFGLNGFLNFIPMPPLPEAGGSFMGALGATGYFFPVLKGTEVLVGLLLVSNRFVPLALTLIAPIVVQIVLFHSFLAPGLAMPVALVALNVFLAWAYRDSFRGVLTAKAQPTNPEAAGSAQLAALDERSSRLPRSGRRHTAPPRVRRLLPTLHDTRSLHIVGDAVSHVW